ncbi:MAG: hypothetical protein R3D67_00840 [Hyphomicrobiaceae bacterium]
MSRKKKVIGTGGELLMHQLVAQGVEYAFTNTGSAEAGFFDAFLTVPGVQPILLLSNRWCCRLPMATPKPPTRRRS